MPIDGRCKARYDARARENALCGARGRRVGGSAARAATRRSVRQSARSGAIRTPIEAKARESTRELAASPRASTPMGRRRDSSGASCQRLCNTARVWRIAPRTFRRSSMPITIGNRGSVFTGSIVMAAELVGEVILEAVRDRRRGRRLRRTVGDAPQRR